MHLFFNEQDPDPAVGMAEFKMVLSIRRGQPENPSPHIEHWVKLNQLQKQKRERNKFTVLGSPKSKQNCCSRNYVAIYETLFMDGKWMQNYSTRIMPA